MDSNEADVVLSSSRSATALASCMERLMVADPYYAEAVGLGEAWTMDKSLKKSVGAMNEFDVANAVLYAKPEAALRVLATGGADAEEGEAASVAGGDGCDLRHRVRHRVGEAAHRDERGGRRRNASRPVLRGLAVMI